MYRRDSTGGLMVVITLHFLTNCFRWSTMASSAPKIIARPLRLQGRRRNEGVSSSSSSCVRFAAALLSRAPSSCFYCLVVAYECVWSGATISSRERWDRKDYFLHFDMGKPFSNIRMYMFFPFFFYLFSFCSFAKCKRLGFFTLCMVKWITHVYLSKFTCFWSDIINWPDWRCKWNANIHINLYVFIYIFSSIFLRENITIINIANVQLYVWIK